ncbi:WAT1-related protein [Spatholobus suberectus]|nr:WAT1-related protein [Spatholobus suberectus]
MGKKGPLYVAMFKPLGIVFAVIMGIPFLGDSLYLGSVIGAIIVVIGFYAVIWGKSQEKVEEECKVYSSASYSPLFTAIDLSKLIPLSGFRMEQLDWRKFSSLAKSLGTIVSIAGAFIVTLYKGPPLLMGVSSANSSQQPLFSEDSNWILGGLFLAADCVMASAYIILQASILKKYPAELIVVFFYCFFVAIQSAVTCLVVERDISAWSLKPKLSLIGATVIVVGFYSVLWGKTKDIEAVGVRSLESKGQQTPLLEENSHEDIQGH